MYAPFTYRSIHDSSSNMFEYTDNMLVCLNGHQLSVALHKHPHEYMSHCTQCGKPTIRKCQKCNEEIPGAKINVSSLRFLDTSVPIPDFCHGCGQPYPWQPILAERKLNRMELDNRVHSSTKVFIVHGHDGAMKLEVARFLEHLKLDPIILHEQSDGGKTIIEKFESHSENVGFAAILLSPDDIGRSVSEDAKFERNRARQNVIFELGYFVGKLGREHVCVLKKSDVEVPSDFSGVVYTLFDSNDGWKMKLARELKACGYPIDMNDAV